MPHFQIKHRDMGAVLFDGEFVSLFACVEEAVGRGAYLAGANLGGANLGGARLGGARLDGAYLGGANLARARLDGAYLGGAYLARAHLAGTNLSRARLDGAYLGGALLRDGCKATDAPARRAARSDGYEFFLWPTDRGWRIGAGCRWFTLDEAWNHWERTRGDTKLGKETLDILTFFQLHVDRENGA